MYRICNLSDIPEDELAVARKLLRSYGIDFYETPGALDETKKTAGSFLAIFADPPALWASDKESCLKAQGLLENFLSTNHKPFVKRKLITRRGQAMRRLLILIASLFVVWFLGYVASSS